MSKTDKDLILEVTQEEYDEAMKKGCNETTSKNRVSIVIAEQQSCEPKKPSESKNKNYNVGWAAIFSMHFQKRVSDVKRRALSNADQRRTQKSYGKWFVRWKD